MGQHYRIRGGTKRIFQKAEAFAATKGIKKCSWKEKRIKQEWANKGVEDADETR